MGRGARGCAASARRTLRDFMTAEFLLISSSASEERLRSFSAASARSAVRGVPSKIAGGCAEAGSGATEELSEFCSSEFIMPLGSWNKLQSTSHSQIKSGGQECPPQTLFV